MNKISTPTPLEKLQIVQEQKQRGAEFCLVTSSPVALANSEPAM